MGFGRKVVSIDHIRKLLLGMILILGTKKVLSCPDTYTSSTRVKEVPIEIQKAHEKRADVIPCRSLLLAVPGDHEEEAVRRQPTCVCSQ